MNAILNINTWLSERRRQKEIILRDFCLATKADPGYWSEVERGLKPLPAEPEFYIQLQKVLELSDTELELILKHKPPLVYKKKVF